MQTQWRTGMGGATGLDYGAVLAYLRDVARVRGRRLREVFEGIQAAESEVLQVWAESRS